MIKKGKARANTNIALVKYWGKEDKSLNIPMNGSISMTLDSLYTETEILFDHKLDEDIFYLDGVEQSLEEREKISNFIDLFREDFSVSEKALVKSINHVPTAAGLASSASGFAALSAAINQALSLNLSEEDLSKYSRRGSGSSTRSFHGGFVEWIKGNSNDSSYAKQIDKGDWDIAMVIVIVDSNRKEVSSREGMNLTVETSPLYQGWLASINEDLSSMRQAISERNIDKLGRIAERNSMKMHATMMGANPPLLYWQSDSIKLMNMVKSLREEGIPAYFTMDAGPNVKIICKKSDINKIEDKIREEFPQDRIIKSGVGSGIQIL